MKTKIEYLGVIILENTVKIDPMKVAGVKDWPIPENVHDTQSFLGFANFYRRFIKDFARIAKPMFDLMKKDTPFKWSPLCQKAFDDLKTAMTTVPVLLILDSGLPY